MRRFTDKFKIIAVLLSVIILTSCVNNGGQNSNSDQQQSQTASAAEGAGNDKTALIITVDMISYEEDDDYTEWEKDNPVYIELKGDAVGISGSGAKAESGRITVTSAGVYAISGKLDNGQIIVDLQDNGTVRLVLNGIDMACGDNAPIYVKNAGKTIISLSEGTQNTLTDGSEYKLEDPESGEPSAAIFSKDDLTINGTGSMTVRASYKDGITVKDDLKITGGNISVTSADDGLVGRDMVLVKDGNITIDAGGDGIKTTNNEDAAKGYIALEGGSIDIKAGADGIQAETSVLVKDGKFAISTGGGSNNGIRRTKDDRRGTMMQQKSTAAESTTAEAETQSHKGIKAASDITISGGTFNIDTAEDSIHSNNSINIEGGDIAITSGDDGIHADSSITIKGGGIDIKKSYEGIESMVVTVSDGEIHVVASDDGINVNGGNDGSSVNGRPGQNSFAVSENSRLNINGGYIYIDSSGDGLDSNGSIYFTEGTAIVSGPTENGNGAIDYNGDFEMSGGLLVAAGSSGMAQAPAGQSKQYSMLMYYPALQQAGTLINLKDSSGNSIVAFEPAKEYQSVVISSPALKKNESYTLYTGGKSTGSSTDGLYRGGAYEGGTKVVDFTITDTVTWLNEAGITTQQGFGPGGGGFGGGGGKRPGFGEKQPAPGQGEVQ